MFAAERAKVGPWRWGEQSTLIACGVTVGLWLAPAALTVIFGESHWLSTNFERSFPEPVAALVGAALLFFLPGERMPPEGKRGRPSIGRRRRRSIGGSF